MKYPFDENGLLADIVIFYCPILYGVKPRQITRLNFKTVKTAAVRVIIIAKPLNKRLFVRVVKVVKHIVDRSVYGRATQTVDAHGFKTVKTVNDAIIYIFVYAFALRIYVYSPFVYVAEKQLQAFQSGRVTQNYIILAQHVRKPFYV
jgi:hypothetical protein